jgi:hypothetical protein
LSETLIFKISPPSNGEEFPFYVDWFQSTDGVTWTNTPVDEVVLSTLLYDSSNQLYTWTSQLADPLKYHRLITKSQGGLLSLDWQTIAPRPIESSEFPSDFDGWRVSDGSNNSYWMGDTIELMFEVEEAVLPTIGTTLPVHILDFSNLIIETLTANLINHNIFSVVYKIPKTLQKEYNLTGQPEPGVSNLFYLKDRWILPDNTFIEFGFTVNKVFADPVSDNSQITVTIKTITDDHKNQTIENEVLAFTTRMTPYFTSVDEVKAVHKDLLDSGRIDNFDIAQEIYLTSNQVLQHLAPDQKYIYYQDKYDSAIRNYTRLYTVKMLLWSLLQTNQESKKLDLFEISRTSSNPQTFMAEMDKIIEKYYNIILAGGKDTLFTGKRFEKGLFDPNRTTANRLSLDLGDPYPWVNTTTGNSIMKIDGVDVEVRGERTITFYKNRGSFGNTYLRSEGPA